MKNIKSLIAIIILSVFIGSAQDTTVELFSVPLSNPGSAGKLIVEQISGSVVVTSYNGNEVVVKASFGDEENKKVKERVGLKKISNSSMNISAEEKNNVVQIINEQFNRETNFEIKVPANFSLKLSTVNNGDINVEGITGEMDITNVNGSIMLQNISGSASADTTNGDINVTFNSVTKGANMAFSSFNGEVDVTFPKSLKANIKAKSDMGEIFTDFDMEVITQKPTMNTDKSSGTYKVKIEQWVNGKINGGGPEMLFKTFNSDIIIRAK